MSRDSVDPPRIGIIGGLGRMGRLLARFFAETGHEVRIADQRGCLVSEPFVAGCDVVILAVPLSAMEGIVRQIGPWARQDGVVMDIASLKEEPIRWMLEHCRGEVIGTHPLFGPGIRSMENQTFFVWPARSTGWVVWLREILREREVRVVEMEPREHDQLMARTQVLRHLLLVCFGRMLQQTDFDLASLLPVSGPWFRILVEMLAHQLEQPPELYAEMAVRNPWAKPIFDRFLRTVEDVSRPLASGDPELLASMIRDLTPYIQSGSQEPSAGP